VKRPRTPDSVETFCRALWRHETKTIAALAPKVDPNGADRFGYTPLLMAVQYGELPLVKLLVNRGAQIDQGRRYLTPLTLAARRRAEDLVEFLRGAGATPSIFTWVHLGDRRSVERALARDAEQAHLRDEAGTPLVHHAVEALQPELVALLLDRGVAVTVTDDRGQTALHQIAGMRLAPQDETRAMATLLLDRGADPNARNWDDVTPLHQAVRARNLAATELLLRRGADPNARDKIRGSTPLRRAVSATGASLTAGTSALMAPLTRLLLEHGADPDALDKRGVTVRASARDPAVLAVLKEFGPKKRKK
jgi:ankyrin repeat protein